MTPARWAIAAASVAGVVIAAALVGLLGGNGKDDKDDRAQGTTTATSPRANPGGLSFSGGSLPGTVYLSGGRDPLNADLYRVRGALAGGTQITQQGRVSGVTAYGDTVVVSDARAAGSDRVERLNLRSRNALPGSVIDPDGQGPVFSGTGKLLYSVPQYGDNGSELGDKVLTTDAAGGDRRQLLRSKENDMYWGWGPDDRLAGFRDGGSELLLDPGTSKETTIRPGIGRVGDFLTAPNGTMSVAGPGNDAISIVRRDGKPQVHKSTWVPLAWSPDSRSLLVSRDSRVGLMDAASGSVRTVGSVRGGKLFGAAWVAGESPIQPES